MLKVDVYRSSKNNGSIYISDQSGVFYTQEIKEDSKNNFEFLIAKFPADGKILNRVVEFVNQKRHFDIEAKHFYDLHAVKVFTSEPSRPSFDGYGTVSNLKWKVIKG